MACHTWQAMFTAKKEKNGTTRINIYTPQKQGEDMNGKKCKMTVEIFGEAYPIKADIEPERVVQVAALLDRRMKQVANDNPRLSAAKIAILTALNMADDYLRLEQDYQQLIQMLKEGK
jgi:cell division protein ZapA